MWATANSGKGASFHFTLLTAAKPQEPKNVIHVFLALPRSDAVIDPTPVPQCAVLSRGHVFEPNRLGSCASLN